MKAKIFFILLLSVIGVNLLKAEHITVEMIVYLLDETNHTAKVINAQRGIGNYGDKSAITNANIRTSITYRGTSYRVTSIGKSAFEDCDRLVSASIPSTIDTVGEAAFRRCKALSTVVISAKIIEKDAFSGCINLQNIVLNEGVVKIGEGAFDGKFTSISIPNSVMEIERDAFSSTPLQFVKFGNGIKRIENSAFWGTSLREVIIPQNVTSIGKNAFAECKQLSKVTIHSKVENVEDAAFAGCTSLQTFELANDNPYYTVEDGVLFNNDKTILLQYPSGKKNTSYVIPSSVGLIANYAFVNVPSLHSVHISNSVAEIGEGNFMDCKNLETIKIGNSVTSIGDYAFSGCFSLTDFTIPNSVTEIGEHAFEYCEGLIEMVIPGSVQYVGDRAFSSCRYLTIKVPSHTDYHYDAFIYSEKLEIYDKPSVSLSRELDAANEHISESIQQLNDAIRSSPYTQYLTESERTRYKQTYSPAQIPDAYDYDQAKAFCDSLQRVADSISHKVPVTSIASIKDYLRTTRPNDFVAAYLQENPKDKAYLEREHKDYRCHYASFTDFVIQYEQGRLQPSERNCRELKWQEYGQYYSSRDAFNADYDKGDKSLETHKRREIKWAEYNPYYSSRDAFNADCDKGDKHLEAHKKREIKWAECADYYASRNLFDKDYDRGETVVDAHRATIDDAWSSLQKLPEKTLVKKSLKGARDSKKVELFYLVSLYHRLDPSPVFQLRAADFLISHNKKMGKEYKKKGSSFSSKIEFVNAYFADYYKSEAEEDKRVEREIKRIERKHKLAAKRANHEQQRQEQKTVVTTHSWNTIKDTDASASTSSSSALDNPYFENNGRVQFTWFGLDGYVGTSTGGVISILDWRFTYLEISPLAVGFNYIPEYAANLNWPALGRSADGFYYQPSLKFYIPLGSTGSHALTLAGGARLMIEDLRSIRTLAFYDPWFMAEIGYNFNAGLINTNVFARYNGDFVIGLQLKLSHVFTPKQQ